MARSLICVIMETRPYREPLGKLDVRAVRAAAEQVFTQRAQHDFPPLIQIRQSGSPSLKSWRKSYDTRQPLR